MRLWNVPSANYFMTLVKLRVALWLLGHDERHSRSWAQVVAPRRVAVGHREGHPVAAVPVAERLTRRDLAEGRDKRRRDLAARPGQRDRLPWCQPRPRRVGAGQGELNITETVHGHHLNQGTAGGYPALGPGQGDEAVHLGRLARLLERKSRRQGDGKQAVVRANEERAAGFHRDPAPRRPHSWVHDRHVHGGREVRNRLGEDHGAAPDVAKRDQMCYVSNLYIWRDLGGHRVADRHECVFQPVVGQESETVKLGHVTELRAAPAALRLAGRVRYDGGLYHRARPARQRGVRGASPREMERRMPALSERDMRVLAFERGTWRTAGAKEQAIAEVLGITATRYYQLLNELIDSPEALKFDPVLVKRLRAQRTRRQRIRSPHPGTK